MTTSVSVKGQVVIPKSIRQGLGWRPGKKLLVVREGETLVLKPIRKDWAVWLFGKYRNVDLVHDLEETRRREKDREAVA